MKVITIRETTKEVEGLKLVDKDDGYIYLEVYEFNPQGEEIAIGYLRIAYDEINKLIDGLKNIKQGGKYVRLK
jgi:hypothetical protein